MIKRYNVCVFQYTKNTTRTKGDFMLSKEKFKEVIVKIRKQEEINNKISEALNPVCEGNGFFYAGGQYYLSALIDVLKVALEIEDDDMLEWWLYEDIDKIIYKNDEPINVESIDDFYDYLIKHERKQKNE